MRTLLALLERARRRLLIHRRVIAAICAAAAVALGLGVVRPPAPPTVPRWTAARDLPGGTVLTRADLRRTAFLPGSVPDATRGGAEDLHRLLGRTLATPLERGELVTLSRVMTNDRLAGYPGRSAIAVRIPDPDVVALLAVGDRVDLVATDPQRGGSPERLSVDTPVLAVPPASVSPTGSVTVGRLVVLAVPAEEADHIADAAASRFLTVIWNR